MSSLMLDRSRIVPEFAWPEPAAAPRSSQGPDRDTASTSSQSDDWSDLFDWTAWNARNGDAPSDVTTQSQHSHSAAGGNGAPAFFPRSPGPASDADGDIPMTDVESDPHVWPVLGPAPTREMSPEELRPHHPSQLDMAVPRAAQNERPQGQKRARVLESPEQTKEVRDAGACYHCRMNKSKCSPAAACESCLKQHPRPELACVRQLLSTMVGGQSVRWHLNDPPRRETLDESSSFTFLISFSDKPSSRYLPLKLAPLIRPDQGTLRFGISSTQPLYEKALLEWAKDDMQAESKHDDFESLLNIFHICHVSRKGLEKAIERGNAGKSIKVVDKQKELLSDLLDFKLMWKIWSSKDLFGRQQEAGAGRPLGLQFSSVQNWIRCTAAKAISRLEKKILDAFDEFLKKDAAGLTAATRPILEVSRWLSLWQMILIYRQSLRSLQEHNEAEPYVPGAVEINEKRRKFRTTSAELLRSIVVIYWELFHKPKTLQSIQNPDVRLFGDDALHRGFQGVVAAAPAFYQQVMSLSLPGDEFLRAHLIDREAKKPKTKRR
ncbi:hypothetical protein QBC40DRAFT_276804 [Triangularia verruculosa]|uniref:Zn(2)-C6 fungal-type domain-containing protein n=1 Tax=Triangularia verruculosa TaxID=2587418 RepID=A0AAN7AX69_9PEZI|nr:hypothetical protein QBC40DRAFT_276804 [Triangularia verruculosa]